MTLRIPKLDGFLLVLISVIVIAFLAPNVFATKGVIPAGYVGSLGVSLIFFLHGAALSPGELKAGLANVRLHLVVQMSTYLLFPLIGLALWAGLAPVASQEVRLGLFFLAALPSTVSSSVAMTAAARGNVAAAVFNATLSGILGLVLTPLLVALVTVGAHGSSFADQFLAIARSLLLPFIAGQVLQPWLGRTMRRHKRAITRFDQGVIALIVLGSFADSAAEGIWRNYSWLLLLQIAGLTAGLLAVALTVTTLVCRKLRFSREDEAAAVFCGSKKSLANGAPMAAIIFGTNATLGVVMLPLLIYHQLQLIVCSFIASRYAEKAASQNYVLQRQGAPS